MATRPITGWAYEPGSASPWAALDRAFGQRLESPRPLAESLSDARARWGPSRVPSIGAYESWRAEPPETWGYGKLGPHARGDVLRSAWGLLELDVADAVHCRVQTVDWSCGLLLERTGTAGIQLRFGPNEDGDLGVVAEPSEGLRAFVVAASAVELGFRCSQSSEPDRVRVTLADARWMVEARA